MEVMLVLVMISLMVKRTIRHVVEMRALGQYSITETFLRDGMYTSTFASTTGCIAEHHLKVSAYACERTTFIR